MKRSCDHFIRHIHDAAVHTIHGVELHVLHETMTAYWCNLKTSIVNRFKPPGCNQVG